MPAAVQDIFIPGRLKSGASQSGVASNIYVSERSNQTAIERDLRAKKELAHISEVLRTHDQVEAESKEAESESCAKEHASRSKEILRQLGEARLSHVTERAKRNLDAPLGESRATHHDEHLKEPPANEPVLIRRVSVPPEGLFLEEAVDKVPWVNRCLNIKAQNTASVPLMIKRRQPDGSAEKDDESAAARTILRLIERNNAHQSGNDLLEGISMWMNVRQALVWMMWDDKRERTTPQEAERKGLPDALYLLPAHRAIGMMYEGSLLYYRIAGAGKAIPAWQVIRLGFYNPKEEFRCLSPLSAMFQVADTDFAMDLYNSILFESGVRLSGFISLKGSSTREKIERYEQLMRKYQGVGNAHTVMVFDDDANFQSMSGTKDMDYEKLAASSKNKIATAFGVPLFMLGEPERGGKTSAQVTRRSFWQDTLLPEIRKPTDKFNVHLVPFAKDQDVFIEPDLSKVEALADDRSEFAQAFLQTAQGAAQLVNVGIMTDEDCAELFKQRFDIEVSGQLPDDSYEEDEEIMAEEDVDQGDANTNPPEKPSATPSNKPGKKPNADQGNPKNGKKNISLALGQVKNLVLSRLRRGPQWEPAPISRVRFVLVQRGVDYDKAQRLAVAIARKVKSFRRDKDQVAKYFDGLISLARPSQERQERSQEKRAA